MGRAAAHPEQAAIAAVARRYGGEWNGRYLALNDREVALQIVALGQKIAGDDGARPRLRFDKVVLSLFADLRAAAADAISPGEAVIVTVTAPVRLGGKTAAAIAGRIRDGLGRSDVSATIHGNRVRLRHMAGMPKQMPRLIGFVHNPETDPGPVLDLTQRFVQGVGEAARRRVSRSSTRERWLVLTNRHGHPYTETYRRIRQQIAMPAGFAKILVMLPDGTVEDLTD
jgi:hypothetical protein